MDDTKYTKSVEPLLLTSLHLSLQAMKFCFSKRSSSSKSLTFSLAIDRSCSCVNICCFNSCSCWAWPSWDLISLETIWAWILSHLVSVLASVVSWIWRTIVSDTSEIFMVTSVLTFLDHLWDAEELGAEGGGEGAYGEREWFNVGFTLALPLLLVLAWCAWEVRTWSAPAAEESYQQQ